jgi:hypothetical protein
MSTPVDFPRFVKSLKLKAIKPTKLQSDWLQDPVSGELQLEWSQTFADGDPLQPNPDSLLFRPKLDFTLKQQGTVLFTQTSIFILEFQIIVPDVFQLGWSDENTKKVFMEKQLTHTLWPIFRQHVHDGMSRLGMGSVALPWLV